MIARLKFLVRAARRQTKARWLGSVVTLTVGLSSGAAAQNVTPPAAPRNAGGVDEIVVTAQKRSQNLQAVPISVTALSAQSLQVNRVTNVSDLTGLAPGLLSRTNAGALGSPSFSMRGVYATASAASQDREISLYLDGVYVGGNRGSVFDLPDIERIEVLRGPQGTLFGRNSTAGAISVVTRDPDGQFSARQEVTVGNYDQFRTRTTVNTPEVGPFSGYVSYVHDQRRGDVRNIGAGTSFDRTSPFTRFGVTRSPKWLGSRNFENVFAAVKFDPIDSFRMVYKFDRSDGVYTPEARTTAAINPNSFIGGLFLQLLAAQPPGGGAFGPVVLNPADIRPRATNNAWTQQGYLKAYGHSLTTMLDVTDHLSLKNITAYRHNVAFGPSTIAGLSGLEYTAAAKAIFTAPQAFLGGASYAQAFGVNGDQPIGTYFAGYEGNSYGRSRQISSETQLNYESDLLTITAGALYYRQHGLESGLPGMNGNFGFQPVPFQIPLGNILKSTSKSISIAAYGQAEVHLTPQLDLVLGGRVTKDRKTGNLATGGVFTGTRTEGSIDPTTITNFPFKFKKTKPTFSVGLNYTTDRDLLLYAKYSTAFLSGGAVGPISFAPETVKSQEAGIKSEFFDRRLRVNLALYNAVYRHSQAAVSGSVVTINGVPQTPLSVVVIDNGTLKSYGFELEVTAAPTRGVTLGGSIGYSHFNLTSPNPALTQGDPYNQPGVSPWIGSTYAQYQSSPIFGDSYVLLRLDANYQGRYRNVAQPNIATTIPSFAPYAFAKSRWILNGRVALRDMKIGPVDAEVALWARNLTNNRDSVTGLKFGDFQFDSSFQPARTIGIDFIVNFR